MLRSPFVRWGLGAIAVVTVLGVLRTKPWDRAVSSPAPGQAASSEGETLAVGFLPVTCHLTCPVTDYASKTSRATRFESQRFTDFPTVVETLKSGRLDATFMIAPLAMKLREQGVKVKIAYLGHRDGSTVMVRTDLPAKSLRDLKGRTFAIPSKYSNQNLVIRKLMTDEGVDPETIRFVEMPPPDMPGALASKAIDAYFIGEPHAARAELDGSGRVLYHAKDIWPRFISCVLVVTERLIEERPAVVKDLVRGIAESGEWADRHRVEAARLVSPYFRQDEALVRYVLTQPPDRVSYRMLTPGDEEMQRIADMGLAAGILERRLDVTKLVDRQFIPADIAPARIDVP
jgi:NitT/TauT family transport system substrate-binding protein